MKTTSKSILIALLMLLPGIVSAQYVTVFATNNTPVTIELATNQVLHVLSFTGGRGGGFLSATKSSITQQIFTSVPGTGTPQPATSAFFAGPMTFTMVSDGTTDAKLCLTYKIFDNSTGIGSPLPVNTVVIPTDAAGNVNIILESSTDLVTWTAASPGSYGSSTSKRFFRLRAVAQ